MKDILLAVQCIIGLCVFAAIFNNTFKKSVLITLLTGVYYILETGWAAIPGSSRAITLISYVNLYFFALYGHITIETIRVLTQYAEKSKDNNVE